MRARLILIAVCVLLGMTVLMYLSGRPTSSAPSLKAPRVPSDDRPAAGAFEPYFEIWASLPFEVREELRGDLPLAKLKELAAPLRAEEPQWARLRTLTETGPRVSGLDYREQIEYVHTSALRALFVLSVSVLCDDVANGRDAECTDDLRMALGLTERLGAGPTMVEKSSALDQYSMLARVLRELNGAPAAMKSLRQATADSWSTHGDPSLHDPEVVSLACDVNVAILTSGSKPLLELMSWDKLSRREREAAAEDLMKAKPELGRLWTENDRGAIDRELGRLSEVARRVLKPLSKLHEQRRAVGVDMESLRVGS